MDNLRAIDADIARLVYGRVIVIDVENNQYNLVDSITHKPRLLEHYSTNLDAAYTVINHFHQLGYMCHIKSEIANGVICWLVSFYPTGTSPITYYSGETLPLAICIAIINLAKNLRNNVNT